MRMAIMSLIVDFICIRLLVCYLKFNKALDISIDEQVKGNTVRQLDSFCPAFDVATCEQYSLFIHTS